MKELIYQMNRTVLLVLLLTGFLQASGQQEATRQQVVNLMEKARQRYLQPGGLQVHIGYYYANESRPGICLDSLKADLVVSGNNYRMKMNAVETMVNSQYSITLFQADSLMYLTRPAAAQAQHPLAAMDSLFLTIKDLHCLMNVQGSVVETVMQFAGESPYKSVSFSIDTVTGYLLQTKMLVKTSLMAPGADAASLKQQGYDAYSIVETRLSGYQAPVIPEGYFDEKAFFTRTANEFVVTGSYRGYKIFVATPNL
jgi:hypothetical protein